MELLSTKLDPPVEPVDLVDRPRLLNRLPEVAETHLTMLQAPAGYGKTSLLSQWFHALRRQGRATGWLSFDASDQDGIGALSYAAAALANAGVQFDPQLDHIVGNDAFSKPDALIRVLVTGIGKCREPLYLFFDDVHVLPTAALSALCSLIDRSPANARFVVASRAVPDLHLARARARGQLLELHVDDLRFTAEEARSFIASNGKSILDSDDLTTLDQRTEGWITGIKLASLALRRGRAPKTLLSSFTGSRRSVSDFFVEEVISALPAEARDFLLKTSVLDRLCPSLCDAVTGTSNARRMINFIEESGLFLLQLDDERTWYRYHHLFAEFLHRRLLDANADADRELHLRASRWFWAEGSDAEAVEHALKGRDPDGAAAMLDQRCEEMTYTGKLWLACKLAAQIPDAVLSRFPRTMLCIAWQLTRNLRFEEASQLLVAAGTRLDEMETEHQVPGDEIKRLRHLLLHRQMVLTAAHDDAESVEAQCQYLIEAFPKQPHPYLTGTIYAQLLYARREQYQLSDLERLQATAQGILNRSKYPFGSIALQASIGPSLFFAGRTDAATNALEQGLAQGIHFGGRNSALAALPALPLAEVLYEGNDLERAAALLEDTLSSATEFAFVDQLMPGFITQARIRRARGDARGAQQALDAAMTIAIERQLERLRLAVVAERVKHLVQDGSTELAVRYAREAGIPLTGEPLLPKGGVRTSDEYRALAWARIALGEGRTADVQSVAKHWRSFCGTRGAVRSLVRWDILLAQALFIGGDIRAAQRALREAISHAAASRLIRSFVDEGPVMRTMLASTYEADLEVLHPTDAFAAELLETFDQTGNTVTVTVASRAPARATTEGLYGKLSLKEREILALVSSGMRNREVAQKLGMTEGSVKWYMQQVYDKVGTRRRLQAVERARQFGLIA